MRVAVALWSALLAAGLGLLAVRLPYRPSGAFTIAAGVLAAAHLVTAILYALGHRLGRAAWTIQSLLVVIALGVTASLIASSTLALSRLYGGLGAGVGAAVALGLVAVTAPVLPLAVWGLVTSRRGRRAGGAAVLLLAATTPLHHCDRVERIPQAERALAEQAPAQTAPAVTGPAPATPAVCAAPPSAQTPTAFVTTRAGVECLQADTPAALRALVLAALPRAVAVDEVTEVAPLGSLPVSVLDGLLVRPAIDGVCAGTRCLVPWQLVAADAFAAERPFASVPDLRFGVSRTALAARAGGPVDRRIATTTTVLSAAGAHALDRGRSTGPAPTPAALAAAAAAAERYILAAQQPDGRFIYRTDPFSGQSTTAGYSPPRQAGTTLVLCELGSPSPEAVEQSLTILVRDVAQVNRLGPAALVLATLVTCRRHVGAAHDADIERLSQALVRMTRPDGRFDFRLDREGRPIPGPDDLYGAGQAVLALVLVERLWPERAEVRAAVERAMSYTAEGYWPAFLRPFFFLEENWHCLAARAAIPHHRHDGYERFCLDYVAARHRFIVGEGGLGFGNVVPPHSTPSAGTGEALAAAIAVRRARGEPDTVEMADLRRIMTFLLRHQWRGSDCFACAADVTGAFSESVASPAVRIDYVQHAWAALGHGAALQARN